MTQSAVNHQGEIESEINRLISAQISNAGLVVLLADADGALFASPADKEARGRRFLRNAIERVRDKICGNEFARVHGEDVSAQRKALAVAATLDFLGTAGAATVSVLIVQIGLENVCADRWEQHVK
jgi:hypothetical protein